MPHLRIETNVSKDKVPDDFPQKTCAVLAKAIGKPVNVSQLFNFVIPQGG